MPAQYLLFIKTMFSSGAVGLFGLVSGALIARILGPEMRGVLAEITLYVPILVVAFSVSISDSLNKVILRLGLVHKERVKSSAFWIVVWSAIALLLISFLVQALLFSEYENVQYWSAIAYSLFGVFGVLSSALLGLEIGTHSYSSYNFVRIASNFLYLLCICVVFTFIGRGYLDLLYVTICFMIPVVGIALYRGYKFLFRVSGAWNRLSKVIFLNSISAFPSSFLYLIGKNIDKFIVIYMFEGEEIGIYVVAVGFFQALVSIASGGIGTYAMNVIKNANNVMIFFQVLLFYFVVMSLGVLFFYYFPSFLYGNAFERISDISINVGVVAVAISYREFAQKVLRYFGCFRFAAVIEGVSSFMVFMILFIPLVSIADFSVMVSFAAALSIGFSVLGCCYAFNKNTQ